MDKVSRVSFYTLIIFFITVPLAFYYEQKIISPYLVFFHFFEPAKETLARILTLFLFILSCLQIIFFKKTIIKTSVYIPLILILLFQGFSLLWAKNSVQGTEYWIHWICLFIFFFVCLHNISSTSVFRVMNGALLCAATICVTSFICYLFQVDLPFLRKREIFWWASTFGNYKFAGEFITPLIFWSIGLYFLNNKNKYFYFSLILLFSSISIYRSRASLMAFFILLFFLMIFIIKQKKTDLVKKNIKILLFSSIIGISLMLSFLIPSLQIPLKHASNSQRITIWKNTLRMASDHWTYGIGVGNFNISFPLYKSIEDRKIIPENQFIRYAHNEYLQIFSELGIIGLLLFFLSFYLFSKKILSYLRNDIPSSQKIFLFSLYLSFLCSCLIAFFTFNFQNTASSYFLMATIAFLIYFTSDPSTFNIKVPPSFKVPLCIFLIGMASYLGIYSLNSCFAVYTHLKGGSLMKAKLYDSSISYLKKSLEYKNDWETQHLLSRAYAGKQSYADSIEHIKFSLDLNPSYEMSWYQLGLYYEKNKNLDKAAESYQRLLKLSPDFKKALNRLGNIALKKNRSQEAKQYFQKVFHFPSYHQGEEDGLALLGLAICDLRKKDLPKAFTKITEVYMLDASHLKNQLSLYKFWLENN